MCRAIKKIKQSTQNDFFKRFPNIRFASDTDFCWSRCDLPTDWLNSFSLLVWDSQEIEKLINRSTKLILRSLLRSGKFHVHSNEIFSRIADSGGGRRVSQTTNSLVRLNTQHKLYKSSEQLLSNRNHKLHCRLHSLAAHTKPARDKRVINNSADSKTYRPSLREK